VERPGVLVVDFWELRFRELGEGTVFKKLNEDWVTGSLRDSDFRGNGR